MRVCANVLRVIFARVRACGGLLCAAGVCVACGKRFFVHVQTHVRPTPSPRRHRCRMCQCQVHALVLPRATCDDDVSRTFMRSCPTTTTSTKKKDSRTYRNYIRQHRTGPARVTRITSRSRTPLASFYTTTHTQDEWILHSDSQHVHLVCVCVCV